MRGLHVTVEAAPTPEAQCWSTGVESSMRERRHPKGKSSKNVGAALTAEEKAAWTAAAEALGVSVSDLIRNSVAQYLDSRRAAVLGPPPVRASAVVAEPPSAPLEHRPTAAVPRVRFEQARVLNADAPPATGMELTLINYRRPTAQPSTPPTVVHLCPRCGRKNAVPLGLTARAYCAACGASLTTSRMAPLEGCARSPGP